MPSPASSELVLQALREGLLLVLLVSAPPLLASLIVGFVVSVLQAATQIQDQSLVFVPKLVTVLLVLVALGPMLGTQVVRFSRALWLAMETIR